MRRVVFGNGLGRVGVYVLSTEMEGRGRRTGCKALLKGRADLVSHLRSPLDRATCDLAGRCGAVVPILQKRKQVWRDPFLPSDTQLFSGRVLPPSSPSAPNQAPCSGSLLPWRLPCTTGGWVEAQVPHPWPTCPVPRQPTLPRLPPLDLVSSCPSPASTSLRRTSGTSRGPRGVWRGVAAASGREQSLASRVPAPFSLCPPSPCCALLLAGPAPCTRAGALPLPSSPFEGHLLILPCWPAHHSGA